MVVAADGAVVHVVGSGDIGIGDGAAADSAIVEAHDAADVLVACDAGVGEVDVVDVGAAVYMSEEALVAVGIAAAGLADADAADGVAVAVEIAFEVAVGAADVGAYSLIVLGVVVALVSVVGERDVGSELEVHAAVAVGGLAVSAVHAVGEQQELAGVLYDKGVARDAAAAPGGDGKLLLHTAQRFVVALEGDGDGCRADVGVVRIGINVVRAFGEAERTGDDQRLGGDFAARVGLVGNIGNYRLLYDEPAVAVLADGEVVGLAGGHVGLAVHIDHAGEVLDARCVNLVDAVVNCHRADGVGAGRVGISCSDTVG